MLFMMRAFLFISECPEMQCVRGRYPALFSPAQNTMQLFMCGIVGVAHFVQDCFEVLGALGDAPDDASTSCSSALAGYMQVIQFIHCSIMQIVWRNNLTNISDFSTISAMNQVFEICPALHCWS